MNKEITKLIHNLELACQLANTQQAEIERLKNELHGKVEYIHEQREVIDEKKAEIERLQVTIKDLQVTIKDLSEFLENETEKRERLEKELKSCNYDYERLNSDYRLLVTLRTKSINETRTETIKDFVERLCDKLSECHTVSDEHYEFTGYDCEETLTAIDNLAEEMLKELKENKNVRKF